MNNKEKELREILNSLTSIGGDEYYEQAVKDIFELFIVPASKVKKRLSCSHCNHYMSKDNCNGGYCMRWQKSPRFISCTEANECNEYFNGEDTIRYEQD